MPNPTPSLSVAASTSASRSDTDSLKLTMTVPEAGALIGLARNSAYAAAKRGDIPTLTVGRRLLVPTAMFLAMLGVPSAASGDLAAVR